jgi:hypothetical protein
VRWVTEGAVVLHRRPGRRHSARVDELDEDDLEEAGDQVRRAFAARARLAELASREDLLDARLAVASSLQLERELKPRARRAAGWIHLADGTGTSVSVAPGVLEVVAALDGGQKLDAAAAAAARRLGLSGPEAEELRRQALRACRELLELGALTFA